MGLGFISKVKEIEDEYVPLYRTIIECSSCGDKELMKVYKGGCTCGNIQINILESTSKDSYNNKIFSFKTISYKKEEPLIYDILFEQELP